MIPPAALAALSAASPTPTPKSGGHPGAIHPAATHAAAPAFLLSLHKAFMPIVIVAAAATLICGIVLFVKGRNGAAVPSGLTTAFRRLLQVTAGICAVQAFWGMLLFLTGPHPSDNLHFVYGVIVLLAIPVAYVYSDQRNVRRDIIIMCIAVVAIIGAAFRALVTG